MQDVGQPQQWNGYSYANNTPVTLSDPTGLIPDDCKYFDCYGIEKGLRMSTSGVPAKSWLCNYYSLGLPLGEGQGDVAALLRHVADSIDALRATGDLDILGLNYAAGEVNEFGEWPRVVVFYSLQASGAN
ncbi:hypothetical protein [Micromonospora sp. RTGN7]|uniref:hypothetical protein n=1 Tax=Micromonospora sp. RTGN7 TaxID=3016526 RepID=UPI0029FF02FA|nr:hypothetical protein [Micromonospora sp. RTGN7]